MRRNTARHWLHAGLDLLPLILIPVFMIYSHRHTIDSGSIEVPINRVVDFNQYFIDTPLADNTQGITYNSSQYHLYIEGTCNNYFSRSIQLAKTQDNIVVGHKYYLRMTGYLQSTSTFYFNYYDTNNYILLSYDTNGIKQILEPIYPASIGYVGVNINQDISIYGDLNFSLFDLTQMFGDGNEPTIEEFDIWYTANYYEHTLSSKQLLKGYSTITYDDTDIMSQFTYQLYNSVDKYFNMGNVFGMSGLYDWFNLNIFGGNASISIYIVWNIVLYEFVMDLLFLLYALFMWFIDVTKRLIEKPLDSIK